MSCEQKYNCGGQKTSSFCVKYESEVPEWLDLKDKSDVTVGEVISAMLKEIEEIRKSVDVSDVGTCISFSGEKRLNNIVSALEQSVCEK